MHYSQSRPLWICPNTLYRVMHCQECCKRVNVHRVAFAFLCSTGALLSMRYQLGAWKSEHYMIGHGIVCNVLTSRDHTNSPSDGTTHPLPTLSGLPPSDIAMVSVLIWSATTL